jgi:hypothetical protein
MLEDRAPWRVENTLTLAPSSRRREMASKGQCVRGYDSTLTSRLRTAAPLRQRAAALCLGLPRIGVGLPRASIRRSQFRPRDALASASIGATPRRARVVPGATRHLETAPSDMWAEQSGLSLGPTRSARRANTSVSPWCLTAARPRSGSSRRIIKARAAVVNGQGRLAEAGRALVHSRRRLATGQGCLGALGTV